jgi:drug/metabolite transporter (DMT)-like permease
MIVQAIALALASAILHATWNVRLKTAGDPLPAAARATAASALAAAPIGIVAWLATGRPGIPAGAWLLIVLSSIGELAYFVFLSAAYRRGELSLVYPLARGTAPILAVLAGICIGERVGVAGYLGVACILAGIWSVRRPAAAGSATGFALLTGVTIAAYSAIDRIGVRQIPPWLYGWAIWSGCALLVVTWVLIAKPESDAEATHPGPFKSADWREALLMGTMMSVPYLLVLVALSFAPLLVVAPVRESSIVLVTLWSVFRLGERKGARMRLLGAAAVLAGVVLLVA